jgi:hypothetical protein
MAVPIVMPSVAETGVAEIVLCKVPTGEVGRTRGGSYVPQVSRRKIVSCVSKTRRVASEMMSAQAAMRKSVAAAMKAPPRGMESTSP